MCPKAEQETGLLAVDLGLRSGLALYGTDGRLLWGVLEVGWLPQVPPEVRR